jgi:hypothetical protein
MRPNCKYRRKRRTQIMTNNLEILLIERGTRKLTLKLSERTTHDFEITFWQQERNNIDSWNGKSISMDYTEFLDLIQKMEKFYDLADKLQ